jgi:hypothetical protein
MANGDDGGAAEVERLRQENEQLQAEVERVSGVKRHRMRAVAAIVAVVFAVASFAVALPGAWARRTLTNTDTYLSVVGPLASDPAVQEALAREITAAVFEAVDVQQQLTVVLSEKAPPLAFLAGPITQSVQQFVQDQVQKILASEQFQTLWEEANRLVQTQLVAVLRGETDVLQVQNGEVVLNYLPILNQALQQVESTLGSLLNKQIDLPEITPDMVSSTSGSAAAVAKISDALGVTLPDTFGTVVVYKSDALSTVQDTVKLAREGFFILLAIFLLALATAIAVSPRRRRTLLQLAVAIAVVTVIERRLGIASVDSAVALVPAENQAAARAVADALVGWFLDYTVRFLWIALVTIVIALLSGPYPWAVAFRRGVDDIVHHTLRSDEVPADGTPSAWVAARRAPVMAGIAGLAALIFWVTSLSTGWWLLVAVIVILLELVAWRVARGPEGEPAAV